MVSYQQFGQTERLNSMNLAKADDRQSQQPYKGPNKRKQDELDSEWDESIKEVQRVNRELEQANRERRGDPDDMMDQMYNIIDKFNR